MRDRPALPGFWMRAALNLIDGIDGAEALRAGVQEVFDGGRYLLDTVKGVDLGSTDEGLVVDLNFLYHPSCAYDRHGPVRWRPRGTCSRSSCA